MDLKNDFMKDYRISDGVYEIDGIIYDTIEDALMMGVDEKMSVLYLDMIMLLLTKMFDNVCYVKQLVEEVEDGINKIYVKDCIDINYSSCIINPRVINNKFMFRFTFLSDWSRKRGLLKKLNKKSILNFVNKLDSNHIFLY